MPPRNTRGRVKSLMGARRARVARGARGSRDEDVGDNHQESVIGGGAKLMGKMSKVLHRRYLVVRNLCKGFSQPLSKW